MRCMSRDTKCLSNTSVYFPCLFVFIHRSENTSNLPDDVMWSESMRKAEPGVNSQSREEIRRSRRLEKDIETAMILERETQTRMREGQRRDDYNYQLDSMMTCPCEKPFFPHSLTRSFFFSLSFSLPSEHKA